MNERNDREIKILQYGEGNFLRAFADYMIDVANEKGVFNGNIAVVKPIPFGSLEAFRRQDNYYTVCLRGRLAGKTVNTFRNISCIAKTVDAYEEYHEYMALASVPSLEFVISNTTEAGIVFDPECCPDDEPPVSFPAKLTQFLYARFCAFKGASDAGLTMLPVELIENNGTALKQCVIQYIHLWKLEAAFEHWVEEYCTFCSTLVDRIVTGFPRGEADEIQEQLGYQDELLDVAEPFGLWVIEGPENVASRFPLPRADQPVVFTIDQRPYRERKVRVLNGAHTSTVLAGYLAGLDTVGECMADTLISQFMKTAVLEEILPYVPMEREEARNFALAVFERFENPFIHHECLSISLNSVSKWKTRVLPSVKDYVHDRNSMPKLLTFSFAALLAFYTISMQGELAKGERQKSQGKRETYTVRDNPEVLRFFQMYAGGDVDEYVRRVAENTEFWECDLNALPGFTEMVSGYLKDIRVRGMRRTLKLLMDGKM